VRDSQETIKRLQEDLKLSQVQEERLKEETGLLRNEVAQLKGVIEEGNRSRDILVRELSRAKEVEAERVREVESKGLAEVKL
jgi:energy-converting hydrogenase A subunit M